jgi:hypothetical protein
MRVHFRWKRIPVLTRLRSELHFLFQKKCAILRKLGIVGVRFGYLVMIIAAVLPGQANPGAR